MKRILNTSAQQSSSSSADLVTLPTAGQVTLPYKYMCLGSSVGRALCLEYRGSSPTRASSFFLGKVTALGVLCCFALFVCLTLLASFFLPSHLSFKNIYIYVDRPSTVHVKCMSSMLVKILFGAAQLIGFCFGSLLPFLILIHNRAEHTCTYGCLQFQPISLMRDQTSSGYS